MSKLVCQSCYQHNQPEVHHEGLQRLVLDFQLLTWAITGQESFKIVPISVKDITVFYFCYITLMF